MPLLVNHEGLWELCPSFNVASVANQEHFMIWNMLRLFLQVLTLLANLQMGKRATESDGICTHPRYAATATWYHVLSCSCIKMSAFCILPRSTGMSKFVLDDRAADGHRMLHIFAEWARETRFPNKKGIFLSRWWSGSFGEVTPCVVLRWCASRAMNPPPPHLFYCNIPSLAT